MIVERPPDVVPVASDPQALIEEARRRQRHRRRIWLVAVGVVVGLAGLVGFGMSRVSGSAGAPAAEAGTRPAVVTTARSLGGTIAFTARARRPWRAEVFILHPDGSVSQVTHNSRPSWVEGWSPDGSHLLFTRYWTRTDDKVLYVVRADGRDLTALTGRAPGQRWAESPAWSPDGSHIAFNLVVSRGGPAHRTQQRGVVIAAWNGRRVTGRVWLPGVALNYADGEMVNPWSPDSSHLAVVVPHAIVRHHKVSVAVANIATVRVDGTGRTVLTTVDPGTCRPGEKGDRICQYYNLPSWAADGRTIVALRWTPADKNEVVRLTPTGGGLAELRVLRTLPPNVSSAVPNAGASRLAYTDLSGTYVTGLDTSHSRRLTAMVDTGAPSWSPDGRHLTVNGEHVFGHDKGCTLFSLAADGSHVTMLDANRRPYTDACTARSGPYWRPTAG